MFVHRLKIEFFEPFFPLMSLGVTIEPQLPPLWASVPYVDVTAMLAFFHLTTEFHQRFYDGVSFLCIMNMLGLPSR